MLSDYSDEELRDELSRRHSKPKHLLDYFANPEDLYSAHGLTLVQTCGACPEQYDVFRGDEQVAYLRLRHGFFRVDLGECGGEIIASGHPKGDGCFEPDERMHFMHRALRAIISRIHPTISSKS